MLNSLPFFIALRHIKGKQDTGFATFISWLSFIAMALGVATLIVVMSVMNGFNSEIRNRILQVVPHALVSAKIDKPDWGELEDQLTQFDDVLAIAPIIERFGMLSFQQANRGSLVKGIDPISEQQVTGIDQHMTAGNLTDLREAEYGIVLGSILARNLGVFYGDKLLLSLPELNVTPAGVFPRFKRFTVVGIFSVGAQVDDGIAFIHIKDAQKIYRLGEAIDAVQIRSKQPLHLESLTELVDDALGESYQMVTWKDKMQSLFAAIKMEKLVVGVLLSTVIAVATFNIVASLVLMVASKRKDIAVLRTLGADLPVIYRIIVYQGSLLGIAGVLTGTAIGTVLAINVGRLVAFVESLLGFYVFDPNVYFIDSLPSEVKVLDVLIVACMSMLLSVLATLYPAKRAGGVLPAEALRYDH